jgi:seryl-tRNA synthetase
MLDARYVADHLDEVRAQLARRGPEAAQALDGLVNLVSARRELTRKTELSQAERNSASDLMAKLAKSGDKDGMAARRDELKALSERVKGLELELAGVEAQIEEKLLEIPNVPHATVPEGKTEAENTVLRIWGDKPTFDFEPKPHFELGEKLGILDFERAAKLSGARFSVLWGAGARLERALTTFMLDLHTREHGYTEVYPPYLVKAEALRGTGQLPKFEEDLFKTGVAERELYLIPTAEVPLTNLHADEILPAEDLPLAYTAWTQCFRSEAGSYGRDTRGILRLHQFSKVELVRICRSADSRSELETMLGHAEACLKELGLAYRVVALATGDLGFSATFTYDIEVWLPSQNTYREISSCSDCGTFQARRAAIRIKTRDGKRGLAATLNGSGLPIGRTMAALLEQNQQVDGSVLIPRALVPFTGFARIEADGTPGA